MYTSTDLQTFLIELQVEVSKFCCRTFHSFAYFLKIQLNYHRVLSFISYHLMNVLHLEQFENNLFELDVSVSKRNRVSKVKPSQEGDFFARFEILFFRDSCSFLYIKTRLKVSAPVFEKIRHESTTLNSFVFVYMVLQIYAHIGLK